MAEISWIANEQKIEKVGGDMNKIDYLYIKYPDGSCGRVRKRRNEAWKLASRATGKPINEVTQLEVGQASILVIMREVK